MPRVLVTAEIEVSTAEVAEGEEGGVTEECYNEIYDGIASAGGKEISIELIEDEDE